MPIALVHITHVNDVVINANRIRLCHREQANLSWTDLQEPPPPFLH